LKNAGSDAASIAQRQRMVCRYYLRGLGPAEIASRLGVSERTINRDVQQIELSFKQTIAVETLRTLRRAFAELAEFEHEVWAIFHRPTQSSDDSFRKLAAMDRLLKVHEIKNRLAGLGPEPLEVKTIDWTERREMRSRLHELPQEERILLAKVIRRLSEEAEANPSN
jgi:predicted DNA-binding transcriptional regulator YafY